MKKIIFLLMISSFINCSSDDNSTEQVTPVNSTHLLIGKWDVVDIKNKDGINLYSECPKDGLFIDFTNNGGAEWKKINLTNGNCGSSRFVYSTWGVYANQIGYVRLYTQGSQGSSYRLCKADLIGNDGLMLCLLQIRNGATHELIYNYTEEEREYYYFVKGN